MLVMMSGPRYFPRYVWSDEFSGSGEVDIAKWSYEVGGDIRNDESQYYRTGTANVYRDSGILVIEGKLESFGGKSYTSGSIYTGPIFYPGHRLEVRAKSPLGAGVWSAIWLTGTNGAGWPNHGELDVMEFPYNAGATSVWTNVHTQSGSGSPNAHTTTPDQWHVYSVESEEDESEIRFYLDGVLKQTYTNAGTGTAQYPFTASNPQRLRLNLALGGNWGGSINDAIFPVRYEIDYVRLYETA